jgi:hypothetical protein
MIIMIIISSHHSFKRAFDFTTGILLLQRDPNQTGLMDYEMKMEWIFSMQFFPISLSLSLPFLQLSRIPDSSISSLVKRKTKPQKNQNLHTLNPVLFVCLFVLFVSLDFVCL